MDGHVNPFVYSHPLSPEEIIDRDEESELLLRNERGCVGTGQCPLGCPVGAKQDTRMTWLPRAQQAGAAIHAGARVRRLLVEGGRVHGVEAERIDVAGDRRDRRGDRITVEAPLTVLSAGAVWTPLLLMRAGLGGRHVGRHLAVHPCTDAAGFVPERVEGWRGVQQSYGIHPEPGITIEATGSLTLTNVRAYAEAGADFVSLGALTHSVRAADLALDLR